jgi:hypothetical protein
MLRCAAWAFLARLAAGHRRHGAGAAPVSAHRPARRAGRRAPPDVLLNGKPARLAPGARIRNEDNRFEVIGALAGRKLVVHYTTDPAGSCWTSGS